MAIDLDEQTITAKKIYSGGDRNVIGPGQKIDLKVGNVELLDITCPQGKSWEVSVSVYFVET